MTAVLISVFVSLGVYVLIYKALFDDLEDFLYQLKSSFAWLPVTAGLGYDFSEASWRVWVWLPSGIVFGGFLFKLLVWG